MTQEDMPNIREIMDKSFEAGYKDAMDFVCEWLYIYYPTIERCKSAEEAWKHLEKAMEEHLCKGTSKSETEYTTNTSAEE